MQTRRWDKSRLPSRHVTEGPTRAPHRSYDYAMGLTQDEIDQPFVGVATCWNEPTPCNIALNRQVQSVKKGMASSLIHIEWQRPFESPTAPPRPISAKFILWLHLHRPLQLRCGAVNERR